MTKQELVNLYQALQKVKNTPNAKFSYAVQKNLNMILPEIKALDESQQPTEEFIKLQKDFEPKRIEIVEKHCKKGEDGKPLKKTMQINGKPVEIYDMAQEEQIKSNEECEEALKAMNPKIYQERNDQLESYQSLLNDPIVLMFHKVPLSQVPENISTADIFPIVGED